MNLDDLDWRILEELRKEHAPNSTIARELGVSEGAVRQRLKKLKDSDVMKVKTLINPDSLDHRVLAVVAINLAESAQLDIKAREIAGLNDVLSVNITTGRYDLLTEVLVDSNHGLVEFLTKELSQVKGVTSTESFLMLKGYNKYV